MIVSRETMLKLAEQAMSEPDGLDKVYQYAMNYLENASEFYGVARRSAIAAIVDLLRNKMETDPSRKDDFEKLSVAYKAALARNEETSKKELSVEDAVALVEAAANKEKAGV